MFIIPFARLTDTQKGIVRRISRGFDDLFVEGPPGSGKTLISLYAVHDIVNNRSITPLVLIFNHSLYGYLRSSFKELGIFDNITLETKDLFFWQMAKANNIMVSGYDYASKYEKILSSLLKKDLSRKWDVAVVDEVQDLKEKEWRLLHQLAGNIISLGDFNQKIYSTDLEKKHVTQNSQQERLNDIFRFHKNIAGIAEKFTRKHDNIISKVTKVEQKQPVIIDVDYSFEEADKVKEILETLKNHRSRTGIIAPNKKRLENLFNSLKEKEISTVFFRENKDFKTYDFTSDIPLLITAHSAKGLEFENVIVLGFDNSESAGFGGDMDELIYVALTRANSGLYIIRNNNTVPKLKALTVEKEEVLDVNDIFGF